METTLEDTSEQLFSGAELVDELASHFTLDEDTARNVLRNIWYFLHEFYSVHPYPPASKTPIQYQLEVDVDGDRARISFQVARNGSGKRYCFDVVKTPYFEIRNGQRISCFTLKVSESPRREVTARQTRSSDEAVLYHPYTRGGRYRLPT
ncbi:hypothetical protein HYV57_02705 [Candidatus Peregrinibacteria bacterium]|nr:hypothetical protein [Candidatus Peregrinibacteria bacterium]